MNTPALLNALRTARRLPLRDPSRSAPASLNDLCGGSPPAEVAELYQNCDGASECGDAYLRPLPVSEVIANPDFGPALLQRWGALLCFTDDQSNYAGVYTGGPLAGMVVLLHHEEPSPAPRYRSIADMLAAVIDGSVEDVMWGQGNAQFPIAAAATPAVGETEASALADRVLALASEADDDARRDLQTCVLHLLPKARIAEVRAALSVDDVWIPELAAKIVSAAGDEASLPSLLALVKRGKPNGDIAAILAIGRLATPAARAALLALASEPGAGRYAPYVAKAMKEAGLQSELRSGAWHYRESALHAWTTFQSS
ncbi:MAG TPA: hypothetical protein VFF65_02600 [Phycisphaerales bacterium]|nr:hypothetical protein [Phycisphaerales bacterium]